MGTNYYVVYDCDNPCLHCRAENIHLGKSSAGWTFSFRAYPHGGPGFGQVMNFEEWLSLLGLGRIEDELGRPVDPLDLLALIEEKRGGRNTLYGSDHLDKDGNRFTDAEFC